MLDAALDAAATGRQPWALGAPTIAGRTCASRPLRVLESIGMDIDMEMLRAFRDPRSSGLVPVADAAQIVGCSEEDARRRLDALVTQACAAGPVWAGFGGVGWSEFGYGLLKKGRDELDSDGGS
jgi:predicted ArsR family transcriptional regulator